MKFGNYIGYQEEFSVIEDYNLPQNSWKTWQRY